MYIVRQIENTIKNINDTFPVLLVAGPRQVGKTTVLQQLSQENRTFVTLDDPMIRNLAINDPALFFQRYQPPLLIDEIQYAPQLFQYIKMYVDRDKRNGDFWLTGSQIFHLMQNVSESLAGRVGIVNLAGLSYAEINAVADGKPFVPENDMLLQKSKSFRPSTVKDIFKLIFKGSMPGLHVNSAVDRDVFFSSYVATYLQRDVRDLTKVGDELAFLRFLSAVAARTAQELNYADLAKDIGISQPTAKQWMSILMTSGVVFMIQPFYNNMLKRITKTPKIYFFDTGLAAYLTKWTTPETMEAGAMSGAFFETWVVGEIIKSYYYCGQQPPVYFYRDKEKREIDLIIERDNQIHPIEIKKSANPGRDAIKHFHVLEKAAVKVGTGGVICMSENLLPIDADNWIIPVGMLG